MTTIHTIEDLIKILDERPEWNEALRVRMLSQELLNLPQSFAEFAESTDRRLAALETSLTALETTLAEFMASTNERLSTLETTLAEFMASTNERLSTLETTLVEFMASTNERLSTLETTLVEFMASTERRFIALEAGQNRIEDRLSPIRAAHARNGALRIVARIARVVGCREYRVLDLSDVLDMIDNADTGGIPPNELTSFENADIIIEATHRDTGESHYIAVEASYTGGWRDVDRATRNAGYLTRFTGQSAHAVVAAQRIRPGIERLVERGQVHWAQILQKELETE